MTIKKESIWGININNNNSNNNHDNDGNENSHNTTTMIMLNMYHDIMVAIYWQLKCA